MKSELLGAGGRTFAVVFDIGDEFIAGLTSFAKENDLATSHFTAIGSFSNARLGYFQLERKEFKPIPINEQLDVLALVGNIALYQREPLIHAHVRPTLEMIAVESPKHLQRTYNPDIGLALINL